MRKSRLFIKGAILSVMILLFPAYTNAQSIIGEWEIDKVIINSSINEYSLVPARPNEFVKYINNLIIKNDSTFQSWYPAQCGMDCGISSRGVYSFVDQHHIRFMIDTVLYIKHCEGWHQETVFPIETGMFYIHRGEKELKFIKSNGDLALDLLNPGYSDTIDAHFEASTRFRTLENWVEPKSELEITDKNIASLFMESIGRSDYKLLFSKDVDYKGFVVLVEIDGEMKSIYCRTMFSGEKEIIYQVGLYER